MPDTLRAVLIFPIGAIALLLAVLALIRLVRWAFANALALTMRAGVRYDNWRWRRIRAYVIDRDGDKCVVCHRSYRVMHCHHKRPLSQLGNHRTSNLEMRCSGCHQAAHPNNRSMWT
jgi:hypothetical protein